MRRKAGGGLGDLQLAVMQILWQRQGASLGEIRAALASSRPLALTTVATVIARLEAAGLVVHGAGAGARVYKAAVAEADVRRADTGRLVDRLFGGRATELIAHLVREADISEEELTELRRLLAARRRK